MEIFLFSGLMKSPSFSVKLVVMDSKCQKAKIYLDSRSFVAPYSLLSISVSSSFRRFTYKKNTVAYHC